MGLQCPVRTQPWLFNARSSSSPARASQATVRPASLHEDRATYFVNWLPSPRQRSRCRRRSRQLGCCRALGKGEEKQDKPSDEDDGLKVSKPTESAKPTLTFRFQTTFQCGYHQQVHIAGSHYPLGWSFLAIANVPMTRLKNGLWSADVELPCGETVDYKYVVLEEQDWTVTQGNLNLYEGTVRSREHIIRHMAIVAWQPGPNRFLEVPSVEEVQRGDVPEFGGVEQVITEDAETGRREESSVLLLNDLWGLGESGGPLGPDAL